jgi:hypothetical protein
LKEMWGEKNERREKKREKVRRGCVDVRGSEK